MSKPVALKKGYLIKQGENFKTWKKRWFVIEENEKEGHLVLNYYLSDAELDLIGSVNLKDCNAVRPFSGTLNNRSDIFEIIGPKRVFILSAENSVQREEWIDMLQAVFKRFQIGGGPMKSGYLIKQGKNMKNWKNRWFVLSDGLVTYYENDKEKKQLGAFNLRNCYSIKKVENNSNVKFSFLFLVCLPNRQYRFVASSEADRAKWMEALEEALPEPSDDTPSTSSIHSESDDESESEPFPTGDVNPSSIDRPEVLMEGYMLKKSQYSSRLMKQRYFRLTQSHLRYSKSEHDIDPVGSIELQFCTGLSSATDAIRPNCFQLETPSQLYFFQAPSAELKHQWMSLIEDAIPSQDAATDANSFDEEKQDARRFVLPDQQTKVVMKGHLNKKGKSLHRWAKRWFVLVPGLFLSYKTDKDSMPSVALSLGSIQALEYDTVDDHLHRFRVHTGEGILQLAAESESERTQWIRSLQSLTGLPVSDPSIGVGLEITPSALGSDSRLSGYLEKQGFQNEAWKKRYFVLTKTALTYFKDEKDLEKSKGAIPLASVTGLVSVSSGKVTKSYTFEVMTADRVYVIAADSNHERAKWMRAIADLVPAADDTDCMPAHYTDNNTFGYLTVCARPESDSHRLRWFMLRNEVQLYCYRSCRDLVQLQMFDLSLCAGVSLDTRITNQPVLDVKFPGWVMKLTCTSVDELSEWLSAIGDAVPDEPGTPRQSLLNDKQYYTGYLYKQGAERKNWLRRYFVLRANGITYHKTSKETKALGFIPLSVEGVQIKEELPLEKPNGFAIYSPGRTYFLSASSAAERKAWVDAIKAVRIEAEPRKNSADQ